MKWFWWIILLIILVIGAWLYLKKKKAAAPAPVQQPGSKTRTLELADASFPMKQGSRGIQVLYLQAYLNRFKGETLYLDGILGPKTWLAYKNRPFFGNATNGDQITQEVYNLVIRPHQGLLKSWINEQDIIF